MQACQRLQQLFTFREAVVGRRSWAQRSCSRLLSFGWRSCCSAVLGAERGGYGITVAIVAISPIIAGSSSATPLLAGIRWVYAPWNAGEAGKLQQLETLTSQVLSTYGYHGATGRLATVSTSGGVTTGLGWDGPALTSVSTTWPNAVSRTVTWTLGDYLRVSSEHVTGGKSAS